MSTRRRSEVSLLEDAAQSAPGSAKLRVMGALFPAIEPYETGMLPVGDDQRLYWESGSVPAGQQRIQQACQLIPVAVSRVVVYQPMLVPSRKLDAEKPPRRLWQAQVNLRAVEDDIGLFPGPGQGEARPPVMLIVVDQSAGRGRFSTLGEGGDDLHGLAPCRGRR
jgi:hypothetical protein